MRYPDPLDLTRDPIVVFTPPSVGTPDRVARYHAALEWLIRRGVPFVLITQADGGEASETHENQKARAMWFKSNLEALAQVCRGFIYVEADDTKRAMWEARAQAMAKAFPVPMVIAPEMEQANAQAHELLSAPASATNG
ncbi:MAG: hypothetical protein GEU91_01510 [Rhizobiales bacterium]|nr:hypothetical protein [Hyphomicrobiales bacterium]